MAQQYVQYYSGWGRRVLRCQSINVSRLTRRADTITIPEPADGWETVDEDDDSPVRFLVGEQQLPKSLTDRELPQYTYLYASLKDASHHIRILPLSPGGWEDTLVGSLEETPIVDAHGKYEALSYCWGSTRDRFPLHIGDGLLYTGRRSP